MKARERRSGDVVSWGKKKIRGVVYDLAHLDSFRMEVTPKAEGSPTYKVLVQFGCHTFTRDLLPSDTPDYRFADAGHVRCFCPERYGYSKNLPDVIRGAVGGRVYFSDQENFLLAHDLPGVEHPYAIYFDMVRASTKGHHATMEVVSAYPKPDATRDFPKITFATLVANVAQKKPIVRPKK